MLILNLNRFISFFQLIRTSNLLILAATQFLVAYSLIPQSKLTDPNLLFVVLATVLIAASGYIINDYYDIKIDTVNKSEEVIIGKLLSRRVAITLHTGLNAIGIMIGFMAGWAVGIITFFAAFLLWLYSNQLKRLPFSGNLLVSLLTSLSVLIIGVFYSAFPPSLILYSLFAFFISLIREIIKDMQDMKGDQLFGCKTVPIVWGIRKTKQLLYLIELSFLLGLCLIFFYFTTSSIYYFISTLLPSMIYLNLKLVRADTSKDFKFLSNCCKIIMLIGLISMLFI